MASPPLCARAGFPRGARLDGERVDRVLHQLAERLVDEAVARERGLAGEGARDDGQPPVGAAAGPVAGVAAMALALVLELERLGLEDGEARADLLGGLGDAQDLSSTYLERNAACASTNASISPMPPNSLKLTQALSEKL